MIYLPFLTTPRTKLQRNPVRWDWFSGFYFLNSFPAVAVAVYGPLNHPANRYPVVGGEAQKIQSARLRTTDYSSCSTMGSTRKKDLVTNATDGKAPDVSSTEIRHIAADVDAVLCCEAARDENSCGHWALPGLPGTGIEYETSNCEPTLPVRMWRSWISISVPYRLGKGLAVGFYLEGLDSRLRGACRIYLWGN